MRRLRPSHIFIFVAFLIPLLWYAPLLLGIVKPQISFGQPTTIESVLSDNHLYYPRLKITAPISVDQGTNPLQVSDWQRIKESLKKGLSASFLEDDFAAAPLVWLTGHSSDTYPHRYSAVFAPLGQAKEGDILAVKIEGVRYDYRVIAIDVLAPTDRKAFAALAPVEGEAPRLVLVTCWPLLTTWQRLVVVAARSS